MVVDVGEIRNHCTEAVFERAATYRDEGRVRTVARFGDRVTATVAGTRLYDLVVDLDADGFAPRCSCPYEGPGACKHAVAVLLTCAHDPPADDAERVERALDGAATEDLRAFVREECVRRPATRERLLAAFGVPSGRSVEEYRADVDLLFERHADDDGVVVATPDFSRFTDVAERYREHGADGEAATVYRALVAGIDDNVHRVDAAYDHYRRTFRSALSAYVDCVSTMAPESERRQSHVAFLSERASTGAEYRRDDYAAALVALRDRAASGQ